MGETSRRPSRNSGSLISWLPRQEKLTLDRLPKGRFVLAVGLGSLDDKAFGNVGEPTEKRVFAERLDESLAILEGLWSGEPFPGRRRAGGALARADGMSTSDLIRKGLRLVASGYYRNRRPPSTGLFVSTDAKLGDEAEHFADLEG